MNRIQIYSVTEVWNDDNTSPKFVTEDIELLECDCSLSGLCDKAKNRVNELNLLYSNSYRKYYCEIVEK